MTTEKKKKKIKEEGQKDSTLLSSTMCSHFYHAKKMTMEMN